MCVDNAFLHFLREAARSSHAAKAVATARQHEQDYGWVPGQRRHLRANGAKPDGEAARSRGRRSRHRSCRTYWPYCGQGTACASARRLLRPAKIRGQSIRQRSSSTWTRCAAIQPTGFLRRSKCATTSRTSCWPTRWRSCSCEAAGIECARCIAVEYVCVCVC